VHQPKLEEFVNESLDFEYTICAALEGALASRDRVMISRFKLLRPDGVLIS